MPASSSSAVRRRSLASELRRLRTTADKTAEDVGAVLGWSRAKISRYELAHDGLKPADVASLLEFDGVQGSHREQLLALAEEGTHKGWWKAYDDVPTEGRLEYIGLEAEATSILEWHQQHGDWSVMHAQLQRLADVAELPNVTIQIVSLKGNRRLAVDSSSTIPFGNARETMLHEMSAWHTSATNCTSRNASPLRKPRADHESLPASAK